VVMKKKSMMGSEKRMSAGAKWLWGILILILKVAGIALVVQGFILQLATGILYYGALHYALGVIALWISWHLHMGKCQGML